MTYGITAEGFRRKTFEEINEEMESRAKNLFGNDIDLSDTSPDGMHIKNAAYEIAELWKLAEDIYYSAYKDTAEGISLSYVGKYIGIKRKEGKKSIVELDFTGTPGTIIPSNFKVETGGDNTKVFYTDMEVTIDALGAASVSGTAEMEGSSYNVSSNTITIITNPLPGVNSVTNLEEAYEGQDVESDISFRSRYDDSIEKGGTATINAILAAVSEVATDVKVFQNYTSDTDADGRPPKSVEVVALGGSDEDIAYAIFGSISGGIEPYGTSTVDVVDASGNPHTIGFSRADTKDIYVVLDISKNSDYVGDDSVKDAVINYIGGTLTDTSQVLGLSFGEDVIQFKIGTAVGNLAGIEDLIVKLGIAPNPTDFLNIQIDVKEVAQTDPTKVVINYV